ncbi:MAG TPA: DUF2683 family protein [Chitinophagales bacterium]|nr:DUF2683 family protein [Chitinophagales bacterium]
MTTITIEINQENKAGKALFDLVTAMSIDGDSVKVISSEDKSPYHPEFVEMVKKSASSKKRTRVDNVNELWENL